jgi:hypothetical protein
VLAAALSLWVTGVGIPALLAAGATLSWIVRSRIEDLRQAERDLADERRGVYDRVLEPFYIQMTQHDAADKGRVAEELATALKSPTYRRAVYELTLFASDDVVRAYGDIINNESHPQPENHQVLWARLFRAIRKSVGNKRTKLTLAEMVRPIITDIDDADQPLLQILTNAELRRQL